MTGAVCAEQRSKTSIAGSAVLLFCLAVFSFAHIHQGDLSVDGIRYASIARALLENGRPLDLFDPYSGQPYGNKPPVLFWLIALSMHFLGPTTFAVRLPGVLFCFAAFVLLFRCVSRAAGRRAALFTVLLFGLNAVVFRSVVDAGFEGMLLCGAIIFLDLGLMKIRFPGRRLLNWRPAGLAAALMLFSKPPYLLLPACALAYVHSCAPGVRISVRRVAAHALAAAAILIAGLYVVSFSAGAARAVENQLVEPLTIAGFWPNVKSWLVAYFGYLGPLSVMGTAILAYDFLKRRPFDHYDRFLLVWLLPAAAIMLFAVCRGRYLLVPLLGMAVYTGRRLDEALPEFSLARFERFLGICALAGMAALNGFNVRVHREQPVLGALRADADLRAASPVICVGSGGAGDIAHPTKRRAELSIELAFGGPMIVHDPATLPNPPPELLLADDRCAARLRERGVKIHVLRRYAEAHLISTGGNPPSIAAIAKP